MKTKAHKKTGKEKLKKLKKVNIKTVCGFEKPWSQSEGVQTG